ncbi:MAG: TIGR04283 family arsenosugar biosynthesis glycosyltransferase [Gammaproteobacteria bacterium]|nr:TIGR04283 family arsenosugar biosynthesis glycosyltransferase [Gammaproteobacteria bacterium]MCI0590457.1 TIGR04283 family arsenosugar biosynthesis glycosyltransferase [Gammaproteobacteria bacterium]
MSRLSVIIPTLNQADEISGMLCPLQSLRARHHEVIVVDGGSDDGMRDAARGLADSVILGTRGRGRQMNAGAALATGEILIFLHADTRLPEGVDRFLPLAMAESARDWGRFDVRLSGSHRIFRLIESLMNLRSRLTGIATGDQAIFIRRHLFTQIGGFPEIDLMEDIAISHVLKCHGRPLCLRQRVVTSSRRWEQYGIFRTIIKMWYLRLAYMLGADPSDLAEQYDQI